MHRIQVIDSHTAGEPTRLVIEGGPDLGGAAAGSVADRQKVFREQHDKFRSAVVNEPRGSDVLVGGLLVEPSDPSCVTGVIYFNNVGPLGMCGHGTIGLVATLAHMNLIQPGTHRIDTCVGIVTTTLHEDGSASVQNVPSYRTAADVEVEVPGLGKVKGDIAWGGNWFYLVSEHDEELTLANVEHLTDVSWRIRKAINIEYPEIDHIELFVSPPSQGGAGGGSGEQSADASLAPANSRNFVLCPGKAYDRSPCGTGTSAKLACLAAAGKLKPGETWVQESILGTRFAGTYEWIDESKGIVLPTITGRAFVNAESTLLLDDRDPFRFGIRAES